MQRPSISSEMQAMNSLLHQIPLQDRQNAGNTCTHQQIQNPNFHPTLPHDNFLEQMLYSLPSSGWTDLSDEMARSSNLEKNNVGLHYDEIPASKLRQHPINGGGNQSELKMMMQQQQQMMMAGRIGAAAGVMVRPSAADDAGGFTVPMSLKSSHQNEIVAFKSARRQQGAEGSVQARYNRFSDGSLYGTNHLATALNQPRHVNPPQTQNYGAPEVVAINQVPATNESNIGTAVQPKQKVRARRGQATDPHSIAERLRRERIAERMRALQELVPTANKTDKASMLDEIIDYVKFLQLQVKVLSVSKLGGAAAAADISSEGGGGGDCIQTSAHGPQTNDSLTVMEHQVAKLMEEDLGAAMRFLQEKGLCLMPISLATAISTTTTTTCRSSNPMISSNSGYPIGKHKEGPPSPSMSVLTVQSATKGNGDVNGFVKDAASVSQP